MGGRRWVVSLAAVMFIGGSAGGGAATGSVPPRVRLSTPREGLAVATALEGAARSLGLAECSLILTDFTDTRGRPLREKLETLGFSGPEYLRVVLFRSAAPRLCEHGQEMAFTTPGSRVVFVCPLLSETQRRDPALAEALILHEALHTLGLGEDPPTSQEITRRVLTRCAR